MSGSGPIYEYQRELTAKLEQVMRERDEARACLAFERVTVAELRAEVERLLTAPRTFVTEAAYDEALAEGEDLRSRLAALQETNAATMRVIAEAQREACSDEVYSCRNAQWLAEVAKVVRATPLVTEGDK